MIQEIRKHKWVNRWSQPSTFITPTYCTKQYVESLNKVFNFGITHSLYFFRKGHVTCYMQKDVLDEVGKKFANIVEDNTKTNLLIQNGINTYDKLVSIMGNLFGKIPSKEEFNHFLQYFNEYLAYHCFFKKTVDYLSPVLLKENFEKFQKARQHTEDVYKRSELFFNSLIKVIQEKEGFSNLCSLAIDELQNYIETKSLPTQELINKRFNGCVLFSNNQENIITFNFDEIEKLLSSNSLQGKVAYEGTIKGKVRIIGDNRHIEDGEILVTKNTDLTMIDLIKKCSGIITETGGMLSHAVIISREMKKPCIIGTTNATKLLKDGDYVEVVDGFVKKIFKKIKKS